MFGEGKFNPYMLYQLHIKVAASLSGLFCCQWNTSGHYSEQCSSVQVLRSYCLMFVCLLQHTGFQWMDLHQLVIKVRKSPSMTHSFKDSMTQKQVLKFSTTSSFHFSFMLLLLVISSNFLFPVHDSFSLVAFFHDSTQFKHIILPDLMSVKHVPLPVVQSFQHLSFSTPILGVGLLHCKKANLCFLA